MFDLTAIALHISFLLWGVPLTIGLSLAAFVLGSTLAVPLALMRMQHIKVLRMLALSWIEFFRTTPPLVHIVWIYYVLPGFGIRLSDLTVIVIALAGSTSAQMAEILRGGLQAIPRGQIEAAIVVGLSAWQRLRYVTLPQAMRLIMAPACNTIVSLIKDSSLAAIIAVPELMNRGQMLSIRTFRPLETLTIVALLYFVLTYPIALAAAALERRSRVGFHTV